MKRLSSHRVFLIAISICTLAFFQYRPTHFPLVTAMEFGRRNSTSFVHSYHHQRPPFHFMHLSIHWKPRRFWYLVIYSHSHTSCPPHNRALWGLSVNGCRAPGVHVPDTGNISLILLAYTCVACYLGLCSAVGCFQTSRRLVRAIGVAANVFLVLHVKNVFPLLVHDSMVNSLCVCLDDR